MKAENWLKLDADFYDDDKLIEMELTLGKSACYVYFMIIGKLRVAENYEIPTNYRTLAVKVRSTEQEVKSIIEDFDLFLIDRDVGLFTSARLQRDMRVKDAGREERVSKAKKAAEARWASVNNFAETGNSIIQSEDAVLESDSNIKQQGHSFVESDLQIMADSSHVVASTTDFNGKNATLCSSDANAMLTDAKKEKEKESIEREINNQEYFQEGACADENSCNLSALSDFHSSPLLAQAVEAGFRVIESDFRVLASANNAVLSGIYAEKSCKDTTFLSENYHQSENSSAKSETQIAQIQTNSIYERYVRDYCYPTDGILEQEIMPFYPRKCTTVNKVKFLFRNMGFTQKQMQELIDGVPKYAEYIKQTGTEAVNLYKYLSQDYWETDWPEQTKQQLEIQARMRARQATTSPSQTNQYEQKMIEKPTSDQQLLGMHEDELFQKLVEQFPNVDSPAQAYLKWVMLSDKHKKHLMNVLPDYINYIKTAGHSGYILANFLTDFHWNKDWKTRTEAEWKRRKELAP